MSYSILHLHSEMSILDGTIRVPELVEFLKANKIQACAITDHGWMGGTVNFYKECKKNDIKPIIGCEIYLTNNPPGTIEKIRDNDHLIVLCKDYEGYSRLSTLLSNAFIDNFYYKPRIYTPLLKELAGHVVILTACLAGSLAKRCLFNVDTYGRATSCDKTDLLIGELDLYQDIFGEDLYLEIQTHKEDDRRQYLYNKFLIELGKERSIPVVITSDSHYLKKEDHSLHEILMAMQLKKTLEEYKTSSEMQYGPEFYVRTPEKMLQAAKDWGCEEAYYNTNKVAAKCNIEIELGKYKPPIFRIEKEPDYPDFLKWKEDKLNDRT